MDEHLINKYIEFFILASYLALIFLFVQIWFLWKDVDKSELLLNSFVNESFFKKNCVYVFSFSIFFMLHEFLEGIKINDVYFKFFELFGVISLVLFAYSWHNVLRKFAHKKSIFPVLSGSAR